MSNTCNATDRPVWSTKGVKVADLYAHLEEVQSWLKSNGVDPDLVHAAAVVRHSDGSLVLRVREYVPCGCPEHQGQNIWWVDWTTDEAASLTRSLVLVTQPPDIPGARCY